jgi:predicted PurR-regulated permease PerM
MKMKDPGRRVRGIVFTTLFALMTVSTAVFLIWELRPLILPMIVGILLAYLFRPLKTAFKYRWLPNGVRITLIFSLVIGGLLGGVKFISSNMPNEKEKLELLVRLKFKFNEKFEKIMDIDPTTGKGNTFYSLIAQDVAPLRDSLNKALELSPEQGLAFLDFCEGVEGFEPVPDKYLQYFWANNKKNDVKPIMKKNEGEKIAKAAVGAPPDAPKQSTMMALLGILSIWFLTPIVFIFFLLDDGAMERFFVKIVPNRYFELSLTVLEEVDNAIGKYLRGLSMECGLVAITMTAGLLVVGAHPQLAVLIGFLTGLATSIPLVGPVVGLSLGLTYALIAETLNPLLPFVNYDNLLIAVLIVNGIVIALDNTVFQPIVLGSAVNLHPLVVILGIMSASMMFGPAGVLLAIPTIVVTKAIVQHTFRGLKDYRII